MTAGDLAPSLHVIGAFQLLVGGRPVSLAINARRLLAFLAVTGGAQRRDTVAGQLWGWVPQAQARATLRTALWRVRQIPAEVVGTDREELRLVGGLRVDLAESTALARELLDAGAMPATADAFTEDILPGWEEDWLQLERERHRQLRIHALEALSGRLTAAGRYAAAIDVAYRAIAAEPLRESAFGALIRAHLAEGNRAEAAHQLEAYRRLLADELGLDPSERLIALVRDRSVVPVG
jgi:DNA-binding SARP family transcriptional activator